MSDPARVGVPAVRPRLWAQWLGRSTHADLERYQQALRPSDEQFLVLAELRPVFTAGSAARPEHLLNVGEIPVVSASRGGAVTYHGPGQLVCYPVLSLARFGGDAVALVRALERALVRCCAAHGVSAHTRAGETGVWGTHGKLGAIGMRVVEGRTQHGVALNVCCELEPFSRIVPCGAPGAPVSSLVLEGAAGLGVEAVVTTLAQAIAVELDAELDGGLTPIGEAPARRASPMIGTPGVPVTLGRRASRTSASSPSASSPSPAGPRPSWFTVPAPAPGALAAVREVVAVGGLHTVCGESACPNQAECWTAHTATFMIGGRVCTRRCGFCLVETGHPDADELDGEPQAVARAVTQLGLAHAVITMVARDDLPDGGAALVAATIAAVRGASPTTTIEVLISDLGGDPRALETVLAAGPDVLAHNLETVASLQARVRPQASWARSLGVLGAARGRAVVKAGLMLGLGESLEEVHEAMVALRAVGVQVLTLGQYLQPSTAQLPVQRWYSPAEFAALSARATELGFAHVAAGPLVRSSYQAREAYDAARTALVGAPA